ncbi:filaggrin-like [Rattus rattus]|uniref:filaggrin-like n=1 Tax=Rattus rattus TaxID=10117 RepID=UPI0013F38E05|nr:filaggrin-like [Rattus rattus]
MSTLLESITSMIDIFQQYSNNDKEEETLSKEELKELLEGELQAVLKNPNDQDIAEVFMQMLDVDHDDKIDFTEYLLMVLKLAQAYYETSQKRRSQTKESGKRNKHDYKGPEERREKVQRRHRRRNSGTDGKQENERSKSPRGRGNKRQGSSTRCEESDTNRSSERENKRHHHGSNRRQRRGSNSSDRKETRSKKHREVKERNYAGIYNDGKDGQDWEVSYENCYYKTKKSNREQTEGRNNTRKEYHNESEDSNSQAGRRGTAATRHASRPEQSPDAAGRTGSIRGQQSAQRHADSAPGSTRTGSRRRGESPAGQQSPTEPGTPIQEDIFNFFSTNQNNSNQEHKEEQQVPQVL